MLLFQGVRSSPPVQWEIEGGLIVRKGYAEEQIIGFLKEAEEVEQPSVGEGLYTERNKGAVL